MKNNTNITFLNHACFIVELNGIKILNDPYLFNSAFNNGWNLIKEIDHDNFLKNITHIYISHEHPDHFSIPFLKSISLEQRKKILIIYQKTFDKRVKEFCERLGYKFLEVEDCEEIKVSKNFYITIGKVPFYDSWINYRINDKNILNVNDCVLDNPDIVYLIKKKIKNIDILFTQFSYAHFIPEDQQKEKAKERLNRIELQDKILKPSFIIPFASFIYFSHIENYKMNKNINSIQSTYDFIKKNCNAYPVILRPNENWILNKKNNETSLEFWSDVYKTIPYQKYNENNLKINTVTLIEKSKNYLKRIYKNNSRLLIFILYKLNFFNNVCIFITDLNKRFNFNIIKGLEDIHSSKEKIKIEMSSDSLQFIFDYDFGFETLLVNARFKAKSKDINDITRNFIIGSLNNTGRYIKLNNIHKFFNAKLIKRSIKFFKKY
jgi:UDP-MurNAc hydroxylase